jgi:hypothetical protein
MASFFVLPATLLVVLAIATSGDQKFCKVVTLYGPLPSQDKGRVGRARNLFARDDKELGPSWGNQFSRKRL